MSREALETNIDCLTNILQGLRFGFPLTVATLQGGAEYMITADRFLFQNDSVVH